MLIKKSWPEQEYRHLPVGEAQLQQVMVNMVLVGTKGRLPLEYPDEEDPGCVEQRDHQEDKGDVWYILHRPNQDFRLRVHLTKEKHEDSQQVAQEQGSRIAQKYFVFLAPHIVHKKHSQGANSRGNDHHKLYLSINVKPSAKRK